MSGVPAATKGEGPAVAAAADAVPTPALEHDTLLTPPPTSIEEAAFLLGASITRLDPTTLPNHLSAVPPPVGMHSSFSTVRPVPGSELFVRLASLRGLLRERAGLGLAGEEPEETTKAEEVVEPLPAAPSLLAVLMKILAMTSGIASSPSVMVSAEGGDAAAGVVVGGGRATGIGAEAGGSSAATGGGGSGSGVPAAGSSTPTSRSSTPTRARGPMGGGTPIVVSPNSRSVPVRPTPPLLSTPIRTLWVDCVVLCYRLGQGLTGAARVDLMGFLRRMMEIVAVNPRSGRASGGTRLAALSAISALFTDPTLCLKIAPWSYDVLHLCHKGLKSSGTNEPHYRTLSVQTATSVAIGCRTAAIKAEEEAVARGAGGGSKVGTYVVRQAWEDRATTEAVKLLLRGADDRYPEVRGAAAEFACAVSPLLVRSDHHRPSGSSGTPLSPAGGADPLSPLSSLEDVIHLALKNIDDESPGVARGWSEALARCVCASIEVGERNVAASAASSSNHRGDDGGAGDGAGPSSGGGGASSSAGADLAAKFKAYAESRRVGPVTTSCSTVGGSIDFIVARFVKCGGEFMASKCGGAYSAGGRSVRVGLALALIELLRLQSASGGIGPSGGSGAAVSTLDVMKSILGMVGPAMEKQLRHTTTGGGGGGGGVGGSGGPSSETLEVTSSPTSAAPPSNVGSSILFNTQLTRRVRSSADSGIVRLLTNRVIRRGLVEVMPEPVHQALVRDLAILCQSSFGPLSPASGDENPTKPESAQPLNRHQLQVAMIELSHLLTALGESAASALDDVLPVLKRCLSHPDHGVRFETAIVYQAMARAFPKEGRRVVVASIEGLIESWDNLVTLAGQDDGGAATGRGGPPPGNTPVKRGRFRRGKAASKASTSTDLTEKSLNYQYAVHGHSLAISVLLHEIPQLAGGIATEVLDRVITVAYSLVKCQDNEVLAKATPGAVCTCVRAGYCLISGALTMGPQAVASHIASIFRLWQNSGKHAEEGSKHFSKSHDLTCLDACISSVVTFLKSCSELLLSVPDALNRTTILLEKVFPLVCSPDGRLGKELTNPAVASRLDSARASIMEAFSWLPPGSFAFASDQVFRFAARHIQRGTENEISCSIINSLVTSEDKILDAHSLTRASSVGQTGGATDIEENLVALTSDPAHHGERESVLHSLAWKKQNRKEPFAKDVFDSHIMELAETEEDRTDAPTPLHAVGTWKQPSSSSSASHVRLLDAAIHTFAATFGMQDGRAQESAVRMLGALLPGTLLQSTRSFGVSSSLIAEANDKKARTKDEIAAATNICATLLACLQALPLHEASTENFISMGPPWMNRAKDLFFALLPSAVHLVRRTAAEGLSLLATLGVTEDAHTLQSSILHSLDELMKGHLPDGTPRKFNLSNDALSSVRAGSLLALACIQRTAQKMDSFERDRLRARSSRSQTINETCDTAPQTMIMFTRVLPSFTTHSLESDFFYVRAHALHAFGVLISYSTPEDETDLSQEDIHILRKAVEAVENNFLAAWTGVSADFDGGREGEKFAAEPAFLAVLLRLMTFLLPRLHLLKMTDSCAASRFSSMASLIMESSSGHPIVMFEGFVFFEVLGANGHLLMKNSLSVTYTHDPAASCMPYMLCAITPSYPQSFIEQSRLKTNGCYGSVMCQRAAVNLLRKYSGPEALLSSALVEGSKLPGHLLALLEKKSGSRHFQHAPYFRTVSAPRDAERSINENDALERDILLTLESMLGLEVASANREKTSRRLLHWLLLSKSVLIGSVEQYGSTDGEGNHSNASRIMSHAEVLAGKDASIVLAHSSPPRWQVRCEAAKIAANALSSISKNCYCSFVDKKCKRCPDFNPAAALALCSKEVLPSSYAALHLQQLVTAACSAAVATSDQAELPSLQNAGLRFLTTLTDCFGDALDPESSGSTVLEQYSSQIMSSVRHALNCDNQEDDAVLCEGLPQLYMTGCEALLMITRKNVIPDASVLKRFVRNVSPAAEELTFCPYSESKGSESPLRITSTSLFEDRTSLLLHRISKLRVLADLRLFASLGRLPEAISSPLSDESFATGFEVGTHSAALALDGAQLLLADGKCLSGAKASGADTSSAWNVTSGLTFLNAKDIDPQVRAHMSVSWSSLANHAIIALLDGVKNDAVAQEQREEMRKWVDLLVPLVIAGLHDALDDSAFSGVLSEGEGPSTDEVAVACIDSLRALLSCEHGSMIPDADVCVIIASLSSKVLLPSLGLPSCWGTTSSEEDAKKDEHYFENTDSSLRLVSQVCALFEDMCRARATAREGLGGKALLRAILLPLTALEEGRVSFKDEFSPAAEVISSCIKANRIFITLPDAGVDKDNLTKAMLQVALSILPSAEVPAKVKDAASELFADCMSSASIGTSEKRLLASKTAETGNWEAWSIVCSKLDDGSGISQSIAPIKDALSDWDSAPRQMAALASLRSSVQETSQDRGSAIGIVMEEVGAEVINILKAYGTCVVKGEAFEGGRVSACADSTKILMIALQHLCSVDQLNETELSAFLAIMFEAFVSLIIFNGLPNNPSDKAKADQSLGRMSAQAIVHVARTSPAAFKASMVYLSVGDRGVLEKAVRADMSGYAASNPGPPTKKTLSLRGYSKA